MPTGSNAWLLRALPRASVRAVWIKEGACALGSEWQEVDGRATSKIPDGFTSYKQARAGWVGGWVGGDWRGLERAWSESEGVCRRGAEGRDGGRDGVERARERARERGVHPHTPHIPPRHLP